LRRAVGSKVSDNRSQGTGRPEVKKIRKPFIAPQIKEEASLVGVTLISGGSPTRVHGESHKKHGKNNEQHGHSHHS
jgi:hypothetical protein